MKIKEILQEANDRLQSPYDYIKSNSVPGAQYFGFNCIYAPEEILHAAGFVPVRLFGYFEGISGAEKYIPEHCCDFVKNMIAAFDSQIFDFFKSALFAFCCDTMQVAASIVSQRFDLNVFFINIPTRLYSDPSGKYLIEVLSVLKNEIEKKFKISIDDNALNKSLKIYRENDRLMLKLKNCYADNPGLISGSDYIALMHTVFFMPREEHNLLLNKFFHAAFLENAYQNRSKHAKKIIVAGFFQNNIRLLKQIESLGAIIVDDDLCEASRYLAVKTEINDNPLHGIADRIMSKFCPVKYKEGLDFADILIEKQKKTSAHGIIIFLPRYCEPQYMEYIATRYKLEKASVMFMAMETVGNEDKSLQAETRIEAFIENI